MAGGSGVVSGDDAPGDAQNALMRLHVLVIVFKFAKRVYLLMNYLSIIHHCRRKAQAYNQLVTSSLINLRTLLAEIEIFHSFILSRLPVPLAANSTLSTKSLIHTGLTHPPLFSYEIPPPHDPFHITGHGDLQFAEFWHRPCQSVY